MSDDLRSRIIAVQRAHRLTFEGKATPKCDCGWKSPEEYATWTDHPEHVADAVIRELRLRRVTDVNRSVPQRRYVTEWETDA